MARVVWKCLDDKCKFTIDEDDLNEVPMCEWCANPSMEKVPKITDLNFGQALAAINSGKIVEQGGELFRLPSATEAQSYILAVGVHQEVFAWSRDSGKTWLRQSHISVERILATDWRIVKENES